MGNKVENVYIMSIEGADIYNHFMRDMDLEKNYCGMIPFSLELLKLKKEGLKTKTVTSSKKKISNDVINVKFRKKVRDGQYMKEKFQKNINGLEKGIEKLNKKIKTIDKKKLKVYYQEKVKENEQQILKLQNMINVIEQEVDLEKWDEVKNDDLREYLYENGFTIKEVDKKTGEVVETKYLIYKRSSSKSRNGQCLAIKDSLYKEMMAWSRLYLPFAEDKEIDFAGLLAYESLVGSALEDTMKINPNNILIVDDVESKFIRKCNVVKTGKDEFLDSFEEEYEVVNSLFDGESLLEGTYYDDGQSMKLLRNHMFKSASFSCNIKQFLRDKAEEKGIDFDTMQLRNMFGELIFAKDVEMICTPTSLKVLKFDKDLNMTKQELWNYWKEIVIKEDCVFGVCKHEKESKRGTDFDNNILQQSSYQFLNSIKFTKEDIQDLTVFEKEYIDKLKNDDEFFIDYMSDNANEMNSNLMFADLYKRNKNIVNTEIFRKFRAREINDYVTHCKKGKIRLNGDYCVLLGNCIEYLYHAIGEFDINTVNEDDLALKGNEIYTKLFEDGLELVSFRNPHTSPSNCLLSKNKYVEVIDRYFNLTSNIVAVNAINFPIQDILSSADYDSDTMCILNNPKLTKVVKEKIYGKYNICINAVQGEKNKYAPTRLNMAAIDNQLSESQKNIGLIVNTGQQVMATYWDLLSKEDKKETLNELMKKVDVATVLSCICIDLAKKMYDINLEEEIRHIQKVDKLDKNKPLFFKYISQSKTIDKRIRKYNCPMDFLYEDMNSLKYADDRKNIRLESLLVKEDIKKGDRKQEDKIVTYIEEMKDKINNINGKYQGDEDWKIEEKNNRIDDVIKYYNYYVQKSTVKPNTMYSILYHMIKNHKTKIATRLMNILYSTQKEVFLNAFKEQ